MELMTGAKRVLWPGRKRRPQRPDTKPSAPRERGLTLVEVPIAMTILGFGLLAMAPMFTSAVRTNASSNQLTNANTLAREKMEELIGFPSTDPRLWVPENTSSAEFANDLPNWYNPSTGATSTSPVTTSPGTGWFIFPYTRTYKVEQFREDLITPFVTPSQTCATAWDTDTCPGIFSVKLLTIAVRPTRGPFPGLRQTTQSVYVRFRDASAN
jgi:type II secretory pathway pseudopilin PulG